MSAPLKKSRPDKLNREHPLPPEETLPTMYDLPSEEIGESGMPDFFHIWQPRLLEDTFQSPVYPPSEFCAGTDVNIYYDVHHRKRFKRPDWFLVTGVPKFYKKKDLRLSYVIWQEGKSPLMAVELLSPGTRKEDLGQKLRVAGEEPAKWEVYEKYLRIPYYVVFDRRTDELWIFELRGELYQRVNEEERKIWIPSVELGLGLWRGTYNDLERTWLRWYDKDGIWIPLPVEKERAEKEVALHQAESERAEKEAALHQAESERVEKEALARRLEEMAELLHRAGLDPNRK